MSTRTERGAPVVRLGDAIVSEITKITTLPSARLALLVAVLANLVLAGIDAAGVEFYTTDAQLDGLDPPSTLSSFGMIMLAPIYAFLVVPVCGAATEYGGGQLRVSLAATPRRARFLAAKSIGTVTVTAVSAIIAIVPARLVIGLAAGHGVGELVVDLIGWVSVYVLMGVIAFGLAGILRSSIAALALMVTVPVVVATGIVQWPEGIRFLPDQAALSLVGTPGYDVTELAPGVAALVLSLWALVAVTLFAFVVARRDTR